MPLPELGGPLAAASRSNEVQGGTALESNEGSALPWVIGVAVLGAAIAVVALTLGGSGEESAAAPAQVIDDTEEAEPSEDSPTPAQPRQQNRPEQDTAKNDALEELQAALNGANLWSTVRIAGDDSSAIEVRSASCDDEQFQPLLRASSEPLRPLGFSSFRCVAEHGEEHFRLPIGE
jgi:hypothetical protein